MQISDSQHASAAGEDMGSFESSRTCWAACTYSHDSAAASGTGVMLGRLEDVQDDIDVSSVSGEASLTACGDVSSVEMDVSRLSRGRPS